MHAVVGAVIAASAQFFEHTLRRAALPLGQVAFLLQDIRQNLDPVAKLGRGLNPALVLEFGPVPADDLAYRRARHRQRAYDFLDRPTPVSYTHLRAHETRHDLVCRLLLE